MPNLPPELYPFESRFLDLDGLRLHYLDEGPCGAPGADPVVMLHGNPTWSFYFRNLVLALRGSYRCIVPDHMGMGRSEKPADARYPYTLARRAEDLEALLKHLGIRARITLVLHDWGGMIGMAYAARHALAIRRIVVLNTSAFHLPKSKPFPWQLALARTPLGVFLLRGLNLFARSAARTCCRRRPMPREIRHAYLAPYDSWRNRIALMRFVEDIPLKAHEHSFARVSEVEQSLTLFRETPMLICWGEQDFVFDRHFLQEWERRFPRAQVHRFPDAGHYVLEDAHEEIVPLVRAFLAAH